ncbi:MAG: hypothetical protein ACLPVF_18565 [Acidimicrobiales bacterium]
MAPTTPSGPLVWCCLPGGGCTSAYFDLDVEADTTYSMAEHLADAGDIVLDTDRPPITLVVPAGSSHCHNQAGNRRHLWDRLVAWSRTVTIDAARPERRVSA